MRSTLRLCLLALSGALLVSGCALRDPRDSYAYGRADGLWDADYDVLLDWNFPTAANQGPVEAPKRFKPERTAIGVPWATGNPMKAGDAAQAPAQGEAAAAQAPVHEASAAAVPDAASLHDGVQAHAIAGADADPVDLRGVRSRRTD
jgi:hypothetical protein